MFVPNLICPADSSIFSTVEEVAMAPLAVVPADHPEAPPHVAPPGALARDYPLEEQSPNCHLQIPSSASDTSDSSASESTAASRGAVVPCSYVPPRAHGFNLSK